MVDESNDPIRIQCVYFLKALKKSFLILIWGILTFADRKGHCIALQCIGLLEAILYYDEKDAGHLAA